MEENTIWLVTLPVAGRRRIWMSCSVESTMIPGVKLHAAAAAQSSRESGRVISPWAPSSGSWHPIFEWLTRWELARLWVNYSAAGDWVASGVSKSEEADMSHPNLGEGSTRPAAIPNYSHPNLKSGSEEWRLFLFTEKEKSSWDSQIAVWLAGDRTWLVIGMPGLTSSTGYCRPHDKGP